MDVINTEIEGLKLLKNDLFLDNRGSFLKFYNNNLFKSKKLYFEIKESYYSKSEKNIVRGMHFQLPPYEHDKLITVISGRITDVVLDLRKESNTYCKFVDFELNDHSGYSLFIPKGLAHGFKSLEDNTITLYCVSSIYNKQYDAGVLWNTFGYDWKINNPILSGRDTGFHTFQTFKKINPF